MAHGKVIFRRSTATADLSALQASDLTFLGQVDTPGTQYVGQNMAMRYVGGERRFIAAEFVAGGSDAQDSERVGDLVEYHITADLKNGGSHWTEGTVPGWSEVRRWSNWTTIARMKASGATPYPGAGYSGQWRQSPYFAAGVMPGGFHWDETNGCFWYTLLPEYPGAEIIWPAWNAVTLDDAEAGGDVSDANIHGPYYFRSHSITDDWKDAASGILPIDPSRQAEMGGTHICVGHHMANIGSKGSRSIGMWVVDGLPSPPARDTVLWPSAVHLYDTSTDSGKTAPNVRKPNMSKNAAYHGGNSAMANLVKAGVVTYISDGDAVGLAVDDCIYVRESPYAYLDTFTVFMNTGAAGGAWVVELYNGSSWVQPSGWACSVGDTALTGVENVFYWPKVAYSQSTLAGIDTDYWARLRRTSVGSSGGSIKGTIATISMNGVGADQLPLPGSGYVGSYVRPGSGAPSYDATHYGYQFVEPMYGGAWVKTGNVEGLAYFGLLAGGGYAYCAMPSYAQPDAGGTPIKYECANLPAVDSSESGGIGWSNGPRWEGPLQPYFLPFSSSDLVAAASDAAKRFSDFLNPASYTELYSTFTGLITVSTVTNPRVSGEAYYGSPRLFQYYVGHSVVFDAVTNQLVVQIPSNNQKNILAFFQVR